MPALLFTLGIIGAGFLAIPIMSASAAYAAGEIFGWRVGINKSFRTARAFYAIIIVSTLGRNRDRLCEHQRDQSLFGPPSLNGLLAPLLLVAILIVATDRKLMRNHPAPLVTTVLVAVTTLCDDRCSARYVSALTAWARKALKLLVPETDAQTNRCVVGLGVRPRRWHLLKRKANEPRGVGNKSFTCALAELDAEIVACD